MRSANECANSANSANSGKNATNATNENHTPRRIPLRLSPQDRELWLHTTDRATLRLEDQDAKRTAATRAAQLKDRLTNLASKDDSSPDDLRKKYHELLRETALPRLFTLLSQSLQNKPRF